MADFTLNKLDLTLSCTVGTLQTSTRSVYQTYTESIHHIELTVSMPLVILPSANLVSVSIALYFCRHPM